MPEIDTVRSKYIDELLKFKTSTIAEVAIITASLKETEEYKNRLMNGNMRKEVPIARAKLPPTLNAVLLLLEAPLSDLTKYEIGLEYSHQDGGWQFDLSWSPHFQPYTYGVLVIALGEEDPSSIRKIEAYGRGSLAGIERAKAVTTMLTHPDNRFLQTAVVDECTFLFKEGLHLGS
ncbi:hypothetical protein HYU94_02095 [Candidatus Daviesbacteria bacterium]|nr:hypothetical protein [Candidatus Daviesbacteria bacterium]